MKMAKSGFMFATVLLLAVTFDQAHAMLKCWRCSSDSTNGAFCADPFDPDVISEQQKYWSYVNCTSTTNLGPPGSNINSRPVCKKLVQEIYGKRVVSRSCFWEDFTDPADKCMGDATPSYIKTLYCRTCTTDGCNSAGGILPIASLVLVPAILTKLFSL